METPPRPQNPLVDRFREDVADGFLVGGVLSSAYHFAKGGFQAVRKNVPRTCCSTAVFFAAYGVIEYAMLSARQKEDPVLNCAVAAGGANGITALPKGLRCAGQSTLVGVALGGVAMGGLRLLQGGEDDRNLSPPAQQAHDAAAAFRPTLPVEVPWTPVAAEEIRS